MSKLTAVIAAALLAAAGTAYAQESTAPVAVSQAGTFGGLATAPVITAAAIVIGVPVIIEAASDDDDDDDTVATTTTE